MEHRRPTWCSCWRRDAAATRSRGGPRDAVVGSGCHIRLNGFDAIALSNSVQLELDFLPGSLVHQGLGQRRLIADDALLSVKIPRAKNGVILHVVGIEVGHLDIGSRSGDVGPWVGKVRAPGAEELHLELGLSAHEKLLHFLRGLVFVVFAQIAVAAGDGDFP